MSAEFAAVVLSNIIKPPIISFTGQQPKIQQIVPSGSPFLCSGQERVLQSPLCNAKPWVRSYHRILSAAAVSESFMENLSFIDATHQ